MAENNDPSLQHAIKVNRYFVGRSRRTTRNKRKRRSMVEKVFDASMVVSHIRNLKFALKETMDDMDHLILHGYICIGTNGEVIGSEGDIESFCRIKEASDALTIEIQRVKKDIRSSIAIVHLERHRDRTVPDWKHIAATISSYRTFAYYV